MNENNRNKKVRGERYGEEHRERERHRGINKVFTKVQRRAKTKWQRKSKRAGKTDSGGGKRQAENANERGECHGNDCRYDNYH